ncbi:hypothetical protein FBU59_000916 [Linderina macrospora]|uniref:Uncharacterized protein n=1 Tax=Linderina macrospora TaxID=4868 RepID=A0ACC1JFF0_9FUNG|nr:hypothetical protein FBU59_000916 [Linderina macrospora]
MSHGMPQQVGGPVRLPATPGSRKRNDFLTPTRPRNNAAAELNTARRLLTQYNSITSYNPFTPRNDRGAIPATRAHSLLRHSPMTNTGRRASQHQSLANSLSGTAALSEYGQLGGSGLGAWPKESVLGSGQLGEAANAVPFARPKSPGPGSPRPANNVLPSFLMGGVQLPKPPAQSGTFAGESGMATQTGSFFNGLGAHQPTGIANSGSTPASQPKIISPRSTRRLSGFGSNDMLSGAYKAGGGSAKTAAPPEDAPPVVALDDVDWSGTAQARIKALVRHNIEVPAKKSVEREEPQPAENSDVDGPITDEQMYDDVKIRSVMALDLPADSESGVLSFFREFGHIMSFTVVPGKTSTLALLYSEPWQAQRVVSQADSEGKLRVGPKRKVRIDWASGECVDLLFTQLFPDRKLPYEDDAPPTTSSIDSSMSLAQKLQTQTPRAQRAARTPTVNRTPARDSPFRRNTDQQNQPTGAVAPQPPTVSNSVLRQPPLPKPRNNLLQTAMDVVFGW